MTESRTLVLGGGGTLPHVVVDLSMGATIVSIRDGDGMEWLATGPRPMEVDPDDYTTGGLVGYDDCFPTIAGCELGADGRIADHGGVWSIPWDLHDLRRAPSRHAASMGAVTQWRGLSFSRHIVVEPDSVSVEVRVESSSPVPVPYLWAGHGLFAVCDDTHLEVPSSSLLRVEFANSDAGLRSGHSVPLKAIPGGSTTGMAWRCVDDGAYFKVYLPWPTGDVVLRRRRSRLGIRSDAGWLGLWVNKAGFPESSPHSHIGIEPSTSDVDSLAEAIDRSTAQWAQPGSVDRYRTYYLFGDHGVDGMSVNFDSL